MAFRPLTDAECGQTNPLQRLTSHITHDHTFSENHGQVFPSSSDQLVEQFLQETRAIPQTFRMDDLMREMHEIESQRSVLPPIPASTVKDHLHDDAWAQQYIEDGKVFHENNHDAIWSEIMSQEQNNFNALENVWGGPLSSEIHAGPSEVQQSARELRESIDDPKFVYSKFMRFMKTVEDGEARLEDGKLTEEEAEAWSNEYLNAEQENPEELAQTWAQEHVKENDDSFNEQFWNKLQEDMKKVVEGTSYENPWANEFETYYNTPQKEYTFSENNPMFDVNNPLERGKILLEEGDFPSAVLCFEAAVKKESDNSEAWFLLGKTQAENEQDPNAIPALIRCLELDPENLNAMMALAVSYTNESYYNQACNMLLKWLQSNPKYRDLVPPNLNLSGDQHKAVQNVYIRAAQRNPRDVDHEVQCGLAVLFNLSSEYDKAADCLKAALSVKPDDARLWNRLGATLANGSRPEEAVDAYHHALSIAPGFIRARYNVGITCINLNSYKEAAEHFLTALNQQARGQDVCNSGTMSQMSETIWSSLRMCISLLNRADLKSLVDNRDLGALNKELNIST
ncbi:peroxisomal targeting signal 1 receptor isoform X2 [Aethina tumida]|uniref:peroxisomal targeting signal 1 receptor isoform X2 n=1 Tax=Aethina tumida TaxID=116153 RepID=UPI00096B6161|nr:peroxisomal targeting signal 1 receptor isoform X2 [Aethina tumida]